MEVTTTLEKFPKLNLNEMYDERVSSKPSIYSSQQSRGLQNLKHFHTT